MIQLLIANASEEKDPTLYNFIIKWLIPSIKQSLKAKINNQLKIKLKQYPDYINIKNLYNAIDSIAAHSCSTGQVRVCINPNKFTSENTAKLYDICALVNFGSMTYPANPIFTKTFEYFAANFKSLFYLYKRGLLPKCQ